MTLQKYCNFSFFFLLERKNSVDDRAQYDTDFVKVRDN